MRVGRLKVQVKILIFVITIIIVFLIYQRTCSWMGICDVEASHKKSSRTHIKGGMYPHFLPKHNKFTHIGDESLAFESWNKNEKTDSPWQFSENDETGRQSLHGRGKNDKRKTRIRSNKDRNTADLLDLFGVKKEPDDVNTKNVEIYDLTSEVTDEFQCINIHVVPVTPICVFDPKEDVYVSGTLIKGDVWEAHIVKKFQKALELHPDICVLDIGANIGQYSLIAANMGHLVLAVEPYTPSLKRLHKAVEKGQLTNNFQILQNAVSDKREIVNIKANIDNQGDARTYPKNYDQCLGDSCQKVKTIHLNDLLPFIHSKECILKLDIQGYEHRAFVHAELLLDKISVPYIFMEWSMMREFYITEGHQSEDKVLVNFMIDLLIRKGYTVYSLVSGKKLNEKYWHGWAEDVLWINVLKGAKPGVITE